MAIKINSKNELIKKLSKKPVVAVSQCLMGDNVRYDGQTKHNSFVTDTLSIILNTLSICPEVEIGLSVPRKPIHLLKKNHKIHAVLIDNSSVDFTKQLTHHAMQLKPKIAEMSGYVFKARSPSCGVNTTLLHTASQNLVRNRPTDEADIHINDYDVLDEKASGVFAQAVINHHPFLPIIDESILNDEEKQTQFIESVFCYFYFFHIGKSRNVEQFIRDFGLLWVLRTGNSINMLEAASKSEFNTLYFEAMKIFYSKEEQVMHIKSAMHNNPHIFNALGKDFSTLIVNMVMNKTSVQYFKRQLAGIMGEKEAVEYRLFLP